MTFRGEINLVSLRAYTASEDAAYTDIKNDLDNILSATFPDDLTVETALAHATNSIDRLLHAQ